MARTLRFLALFAVLLAPPLLAQEDEADGFRDFHDQNFRVIRAKIIATKGDEVDLVRADGKRFVIPVAKLSKEDQEYISAWKAPTGPTPGAGLFMPRSPARMMTLSFSRKDSRTAFFSH